MTALVERVSHHLLDASAATVEGAREARRDRLAAFAIRDDGNRATISRRRPVRIHDVLIAVVDGLKGFPEAITAAFPETMVQTCIWCAIL